MSIPRCSLRLSDDSRAVPTFVLPGEDVELKVAKVFRRLAGPVLSSPELKLKGAPGRMTDLLPADLPDFFVQDQIVLVGRYHGKERLEICPNRARWTGEEVLWFFV